MHTASDGIWVFSWLSQSINGFTLMYNHDLNQDKYEIKMKHSYIGHTFDITKRFHKQLRF